MQDNHADFSRLVDIFAALIDIPGGKPIPPGEAWKNDAQVLLIKIYRHLESIRTLFHGVATTVNNKAFAPYVDHSSIAVVSRVVHYATLFSQVAEAIFLEGVYRPWRFPHEGSSPRNLKHMRAFTRRGRTSNLCSRLLHNF